MRWRELRLAGAVGVPKLDTLARAARAGVRVPRTVWVADFDVPDQGDVPPPPFPGPWVARSGARDEDGDERSNAGRYHSEHVPAEGGLSALSDAVRRVAVSLGEAGGVVFVQPRVRARRAGVAFFDGFHYERSATAGDNVAVTAGRARGEVRRGQLVRGEAWSAWLERVAAALPRLDRLDLEWAEEHDGTLVLLQARRAAFEVARDPLVSVANHREILGEAPSPWIVSALDRAGRASFGVFAACDPAIAGWGERYAHVAAGRAWMDFSAFFRVMDRWGLPRTFVTQGVGGAAGGARDGAFLWGRLLRSVPRLVRLQLANLRTVLGMRRELRGVERAVRGARDLAGLHAATVTGLEAALRVNFALGGALAGVQRLRRVLGGTQATRVVTGELGRGYEALRRLPEAEREAGLDAWLEDHGHRGPLESDPAHPRFDELRDVLRADLARGADADEERAPRAGRGPLHWREQRRERFRDELMRVWSELRRRLLAEGERLAAVGALDAAEDVFQLRGEDLGAPSLARAAREGRARWEATRSLALPHTARLSEVEAAARAGAPQAGGVADADAWSGIGLGERAAEGRVRRADDLVGFLRDGAVELGRGDVLVVPALEPAWGVLFPRAGAVVAELGGELSHASILLRELGTPAVVNCLGAWDALREGERVRVDPRSGRVQRLDARSTA